MRLVILSKCTDSRFPLRLRTYIDMLADCGAVWSEKSIRSEKTPSALLWHTLEDLWMILTGWLVRKKGSNTPQNARRSICAKDRARARPNRRSPPMRGEEERARHPVSAVGESRLWHCLASNYLFLATVLYRSIAIESPCDRQSSSPSNFIRTKMKTNLLWRSVAIS